MSIRTVNYEPKNAKGQGKSNQVLITAENAQWRGKSVLFFIFRVFRAFRAFRCL